MERENEANCKHGLGLVVAFLTGAGIATTAILVASKARRGWKPSTDSLLKKCDKAFQALDSQLSESIA